MKHVVAIPDWRPALANDLAAAGHWAGRARRKRADLQLVAAYCVLAGVPLATLPRRVSLEILGPFRRLPDPDAPWKSVLDALVGCGRLVDDSALWCQLAAPAFEYRPKYATTITLEDLQ